MLSTGKFFLLADKSWLRRNIFRGFPAVGFGEGKLFHARSFKISSENKILRCYKTRSGRVDDSNSEIRLPTLPGAVPTVFNRMRKYSIRPGIEQPSELIKQKSLKHEPKVRNWKLLMKGWLFGLRFAFRNSCSTPFRWLQRPHRNVTGFGYFKFDWGRLLEARSSSAHIHHI